MAGGGAPPPGGEAPAEAPGPPPSPRRGGRRRGGECDGQPTAPPDGAQQHPGAKAAVQQYYCRDCCMVLNSFRQSQIHVNGLRHKDQVERLTKMHLARGLPYQPSEPAPYSGPKLDAVRAPRRSRRSRATDPAALVRPSGESDAASSCGASPRRTPSAAAAEGGSDTHSDAPPRSDAPPQQPQQQQQAQQQQQPPTSAQRKGVYLSREALGWGPAGPPVPFQPGMGPPAVAMPPVPPTWPSPGAPPAQLQQWQMQHAMWPQYCGAGGQLYPNPFYNGGYWPWGPGQYGAPAASPKSAERHADARQLPPPQPPQPPQQSQPQREGLQAEPPPCARTHQDPAAGAAPAAPGPPHPPPPRTPPRSPRHPPEPAPPHPPPPPLQQQQAEPVPQPPRSSERGGPDARSQSTDPAQPSGRASPGSHYSTARSAYPSVGQASAHSWPVGAPSGQAAAEHHPKSQQQDHGAVRPSVAQVRCSGAIAQRIRQLISASLFDCDDGAVRELQRMLAEPGTVPVLVAEVFDGLFSGFSAKAYSQLCKDLISASGHDAYLNALEFQHQLMSRCRQEVAPVPSIEVTDSMSQEEADAVEEQLLRDKFRSTSAVRFVAELYLRDCVPEALVHLAVQNILFGSAVTLDQLPSRQTKDLEADAERVGTVCRVLQSVGQKLAESSPTWVRRYCEVLARGAESCGNRRVQRLVTQAFQSCNYTPGEPDK